MTPSNLCECNFSTISLPTVVPRGGETLTARRGGTGCVCVSTPAPAPTVVATCKENWRVEKASGAAEATEEKAHEGKEKTKGKHSRRCC